MFQKYTDIITMFQISHFGNDCINSGEGEVTYLCRGIDFTSFYNVSIGFWKCSDRVVFFVFLLYYQTVQMLFFEYKQKPFT